ncbi:MAG: CU044_5270 family protein [Streptosporangiaceae bacterium]
MTDDDLITALRESFTEVHSATPVQRIISRSRAVRARRRAASAAATLAAVALAAGLLTAVRGPAGPSEPNGAAAYVLERAARAVAPLRCPVPRPGQYVVVTSVNWWMTEDMGSSGPTRAWLTLDRRRVWESADGLKPGDSWIDARRIRRLPWSHGPAPATGLGPAWYSLPAQRRPGTPPLRGTYEFLTTLPTNPITLRAWIYRHLDGQQPPDDQAWTDITDLLGGMLVPPRLAIALFKVAAGIPGATVIRHVTDAAGRPGIAVARVDQAYPQDNELIFDPRTYRLLGERQTLTAPQKGVGPAGTVTLSSAQLSETVASHLPRFPRGHRAPPSIPSPAC